MSAVKGCQDALVDISKGRFIRMVLFIARLIGFSERMVIEITNDLGGYSNWKYKAGWKWDGSR